MKNTPFYSRTALVEEEEKKPRRKRGGGVTFGQSGATAGHCESQRPREPLQRRAEHRHPPQGKPFPASIPARLSRRQMKM